MANRNTHSAKKAQGLDRYTTMVLCVASKDLFPGTFDDTFLKELQSEIRQSDINYHNFKRDVQKVKPFLDREFASRSL